MNSRTKKTSKNDNKIVANITYVDARPSWNDFFGKYEGTMKEEGLDLSDPITAGILGKLE